MRAPLSLLLLPLLAGGIAPTRADATSAAAPDLPAAGACSPDREYNLGTTDLERGDLGRAVLHLARARFLATGRPGSGLHPIPVPGARAATDGTSSDIEHNLALARARVRGTASDQDAPAPAWDRVFREFPVGTLALGFLACWVLLFAGLIAHRLSGSQAIRRGEGVAILILTAVVAGLGLVGGGALYARHAIRRGVLLADEVRGAEAPDHRAVMVFRAPAGTEVRLLGQAAAGYVRVRLDSGLDGWVPADELGEI